MIAFFALGLLATAYAFCYMLHCIKRDKKLIAGAAILWVAPLAALLMLALETYGR